MALKYLCLVLCVTFFAMETYGRKDFVAYKRSLSFFQAFQQCRLYGGYLAFIESAEENAQVVTAIKAVGDLTSEWYIGATDLGFEGRFVWFGVNKRVSYMNFNGGEPNNINGEHCIVIGSNAGSKWNDVSCEYKAAGFVCAFISM
ncbi:perlucin-like protein [Anopheles stephensi]|uniref:perlucin-like protein n=1 Tax=Anopheles stephensi TaxID=30069 RepID=UPI0007D25E0E|nr:perlucin-like protein [Anopheles stephensi]